MKVLDLDAVRAFVLVADLCSFTRAADALGTTQSAVSLKLKRLEAHLGKQLLERTPRVVRLSVDGKAFLSVVGFLFLKTRVLGVAVPFHTDFEEVNLRFYVRRRSADTWRRGVVFIRELVPRRAIVLIARACYGENYLTVPMKHEIEHRDSALKVEYSWRHGRKWESLKITATGEPQTIPTLSIKLATWADFLGAAVSD